MKRLLYAMMAVVMMFVFLPVSTGCRSQKDSISSSSSMSSIAVAESRKSNGGLMFRRQYAAVPDTIEYRLANQYAECIVGEDSLSVLYNDYAASRVERLADGRLLHTLDSRDRMVKVPVQVVMEADTLYVEQETVNEDRSREVQNRDESRENEKSGGKWKMVLWIILLIVVALWVGRMAFRQKY